jgi:acyl-coenzyme A synthetase/AMP-(fatty) acid ligase
MFGQSENCGLLSANIPKRYIKLGTTGKAVPGVKTKIIERNDEVLKTPMLDGGFAPEIGGVSFFVTYLTSLNYFCIFCWLYFELAIIFKYEIDRF